MDEEGGTDKRGISIKNEGGIAMSQKRVVAQMRETSRKRGVP